MRHSFPYLIAALLCALALPPASAFAQETTATIIGTARDETGAALPGVTVVLRHTGTGQTFERVTNDEGVYTAPLLPIGSYEVTFTLNGFQQRLVRGISLSVNDRLVVDGTMVVGGVSEVIEVRGASAVQPTAALQTLVGSTQVQELPLNNRNFVQLATIAPGVSSDLADEVGVGLASTVSLSINGARRNAINWLVDGVSNVDVGSNITLLSTPTLESIEEFKVITSSYAAEWPRSGGGIVNVVTKSGTSRFVGSGYEFFRNDALNANTWLRNQNPDPSINDNPPFLRYNNFGYTIGGPLLPSRQRAFFFFSQEWRRIERATTSAAGNVPNPDWLTNPASANYVAPADRDPVAVQLLQLWPAANLAPSAADGPARYQITQPNINNTRQEVVRVDMDLTDRWRLTGRYTHDLSETREIGGLFFNTTIPNIATTDTDVPGTVAAFGARTVISANRLNEFTYQFSGNKIGTTNPEGTRNKRSDFGINIPEIFPENINNLVPTINISGLALAGANQLYRIQYLNHTITDNFSWQRGNHSYKFGGLAAFEQKNENAASASQGTFVFAAAGGFTAFQNFLRGNATGVCATCTYTEAEQDIDLQLRFRRFEFYAQDTWRLRSNLTVDYGVRYSLYPPMTEVDDQLVTFAPEFYNAAAAPPFVDAAGATIDRTRGDLLVGIVRAGVNSPFGRSIYEFKKNSIQPRIGFSWDPASTGDTIVRGAYGIYYDQPLVGIFEQNSFLTPPIVNNTEIASARLSNPAAGITATTGGVRTIQATALDFDNPRMMQWSLGFTRRLPRDLVADISYVGSRGDNLIRPIDINYPMPADVVALQASVPNAVNPARPYRSYGVITMRETTARSRYHGLLTALKYTAGRAGTATVNYTLSRNQTDASNDRDAIDIPQNPRDPEADYADARTDRRHIVTASYVYELPFFATGPAALRATLGGWQVAGLVTINSGQPVPRVAVSTNNFRRGGFADFAPGVDINEGTDFVNGVAYWFNPLAFVPPADGTFGNSGRAPFRQPGRHQWDITLSKNFYLPSDIRMQFRADLINAFNQRQWLADPLANGLDNTCTASVTSCTVATDRFGQILNARSPREIQLGLKLYW